MVFTGSSADIQYIVLGGAGGAGGDAFGPAGDGGAGGYGILVDGQGGGVVTLVISGSTIVRGGDGGEGGSGQEAGNRGAGGIGISGANLALTLAAVLAPFLRWLLSDLFTAVRRNRPVERLVVFIDEAAVLGRFDALLTAAGDLPGYGASLWTMWQDRAQLIGLYGEAGDDFLLNTAEVVTVFDVPAVDPDESGRWSRAIGDYTALVETRTMPGGEAKGSPSTTRASQAARLMSKEALIAMPGDELLVFPNSGGHARHTLRLKKTVAHTDARFRKLITSVAHVGRTR